MTAEEDYPGELQALRGLLGEVRTIAGYGGIQALRDAVHMYDRAERDALDALPWQPEVGVLYRVSGERGAPDRVARVIDGGLWRKKVGAGDGGPLRTFSRSSLRHEDEDTGGRAVGISRAGRLVLMTTGGQVMGHLAEIRALEAFELPALPKSAAAVGRTLASVWAAAEAAAGLVLDVRQAKYLVEMGEGDG